MRFCHMAHSMKRIEIILNHIRDKNKFKNRDSLFLWFNISRLLFVTFFIQCFKNTYLFHLVQYFKIFPLSHTQKKLFAFPFTLFTSILLYSHASLSCHPILNTLEQKTMSFAFNLPTTPT